MVDPAGFVEFGSASRHLGAGRAVVWQALVERFGDVFFGAAVETSWEPGTPIVFSGEWNGAPYRDHGEIVAFDPGRSLRFTQFSSMSGKPDVPENYDLVSFTFAQGSDGADVTLSLAKPDGVDAPAGEERDALIGNLDVLLAKLEELSSAA